jgi:hypothetical protein
MVQGRQVQSAIRIRISEDLLYPGFLPRSHAVIFELKIVKPPIFAIEGHQLFMSSLFHNLTVGEDNDPMGISDRGKTMGDDEDRSPFHQSFESLLDLCLRIGIEGRGGFIQDEDRSIF